MNNTLSLFTMDQDGAVKAVICVALAATSIAYGLAQHRWMHTGASNRVMSWVYGTIFLLGGAAALYAADTQAPLVFVSPFLSLMILANLVFASVVNKQSASADMQMYAMMVFIGSLMAGLSASSAMQPVREMHTGRTVIYIVFYCIALCWCLALCLIAGLRHRRKGEGSLEYQNILPAAKVAYPYAAGMLLSMASVASRAIYLYPNELAPLAVFVVACSFVAVGVLDCALVYFDTLSVVPLFVATVVLMDVLGGFVLFDELSRFTPLLVIFFACGLLLVFLGGFHIVKEKQGSQGALPTAPEEEEHAMNDA